jgi:glycosyltransferase involved in cell wall biosynthesis
MKKLSVIIPCYNSQDVIKDCLESVKWADEILVCDSFSDDKTLTIVREYTASIVQHEYINSAMQKNWIIPKARNEWVFIVDTDERVSQSLKKEILEIMQNPGNYDGFKIPRRNFSFGKQLKYGGYWPDYQLRLFKKNKGKYQSRFVHAHVELNGSYGLLKNPLIHYHDRQFFQVIEKMLLRYPRWEAIELLKGEEPCMWKIFLKPPGIFIYRFFYKKGFLDGIHGFLAAGLWAAYTFMTYLNMFFLKRIYRNEKKADSFFR